MELFQAFILSGDVVLNFRICASHTEEFFMVTGMEQQTKENYNFLSFSLVVLCAIYLSFWSTIYEKQVTFQKVNLVVSYTTVFRKDSPLHSFDFSEENLILHIRHYLCFYWVQTYTSTLFISFTTNGKDYNLI